MDQDPNSPNRVELFLWEPSGVNRPQWPVTTGVPFPKGALTDPERIRLRDGDVVLPCASRVTATWGDGSVRWLLLDFQVGLLGNERKRLELDYDCEPGDRATPPVELGVAETEGFLAVENGDLRVVFRTGGRMPFENVLHKGVSVLRDDAPLCLLAEGGRPFVAAGESVTPRVEQRNALRVVVRCDGTFTAEDGTTSLDLTTRVTLFAGKPFLRVYHTISNVTGRDVFLDRLLFSLPTTIGGIDGGYVTGHILDESIHREDDGRVGIAVRTRPLPDTEYDAEMLRPHVGFGQGRLAEIHGTTERQAEGRCVLQHGNGSEQPLRPERYLDPTVASGLLCGDGIRVALACRHFHPQAPKQLTVDGAAIDLSLYWSFDGTPLQLWRGTAKTHEMHLIVAEGGDLSDASEVLGYKRLVLALEEPVAPTFGESNWLQRSQVMGPVLPYRPAKYPWLEFTFRRIFEQWSSNVAGSLRGSTVLDFGDTWNPGRGGQWQNNEMDFGAAMLLYMLRTGYSKPFPSIEAIIHHMIDVDTHHEAGDPAWVGGQRYHQVRHGAFCSPTLCHQWLEGPLLFYLLTGYERAREVALLRADHFCTAIESGKHRIKQLERVQGWPLVALSTMNEYVPDERYVRACNAILDWLEQWLEEDGDLVYPYAGGVVEGEKGCTTLGRGVIGQALAHYHRVTGDERAWTLLRTVMDLAKESLFTPEGLTTKTSLLRRNYFSPGESDFILEPMGYLWEKTGDPEWMRLAILNFKLALIHRDPVAGTHMGVAGGGCEPYRFWPPFLHYADKSGMLEDLRIW